MKNAKNRAGVRQLSSEEAKAPFSDDSNATGVSDASTDLAIAERSGSDDKVSAAAAEGAKPRVSTFTPEARVWIEGNKDLNTEGLFGQRGMLPLRPEDFQRRAQFLGHPLTVADMEEMYSADPSAPATMPCTTCGDSITSFIRIAMVTPEGDLKRRNGNIVYRGQAVTTGRPLAVHAAHTGTCLYKLRNNLGKRKTLPNKREVADLLHSHSFDQAKERLAGLEAYNAKMSAEKMAENQAFKQRLGATIGDAVRHNRTDDGIDRGPGFTPRLERGKSRKQRRWAPEDAE